MNSSFIWVNDVGVLEVLSFVRWPNVQLKQRNGSVRWPNSWRMRPERKKIMKGTFLSVEGLSPLFSILGMPPVRV